MRHKMFLAVLAAVVLVTLPASAQTPSAKAAVLVGDAGAVAAGSCDAGTWSNLFIINLKNSGSQKDFLLGLSGVTQIITDTKVKSSGGTQDTSEAEAFIKVRILVDGNVAKPGPIVFDRRKQTLIAKFNGICIDLNGDGVVNFNECTTPEELQLILDTQAAHHFNFVSTEVGTGVHEVKAQACTDVNTSSQTGSASASALFGKGSLTVEEVRLVKGAVVEQ